MQGWRQGIREAGGMGHGHWVGGWTKDREEKYWGWTWRVAWSEGSSVGEPRCQGGRKEDGDGE